MKKLIIIILSLITLFACSGTQKVEPVVTEEKAIKKVIVEIKEDVNIYKDIEKMVKELLNESNLLAQKISVGNVSNIETEITDFSFYIAENIEKGFNAYDQKKSILIEQSKLKDELDFWGLSIDGMLLDKDYAKLASEITDQDYFCFGKYVVQNNELGLKLELYNIKEDKVIAKIGKRIKIDEKILKKELSKKKINAHINYTNSDLKIWTNKNEYKIGDMMQLLMKSEYDYYIAVFEIDELGKVKLLFPNYYSSSSKIRGGYEYSIPSKLLNQKFNIRGNEGIKLYRMISSELPFKFLYSLGDKFNDVQPYTKLDIPLKEINSILKNELKNHKYGETIITVKVKK